MALDKFKENETETNRVRKLNALIAALGLDAGATISPTALPIATTTTVGVAKVGSGLSITGAGLLSAP